MRIARILLCVSGGIAAFKSVQLLRLLKKAGVDVKVMMTENATRFVGPLTFEALSQNPVVTDLWSTGRGGGENHILLTEWADLIVVAPATANILAKMAQGLADDFVSTALLAAACKIVVAPAMHTRMYENPSTVANLEILERRGIGLIEPASGDLASGQGKGRMAEPEDIVEHILSELTKKDLSGESILITAGPTLEAIDPVRYITNRSTGKMGYALARAATRRGAEVTLVSGPVLLDAPYGVDFVEIKSAADMFEAVKMRWQEMSVIIMAAAVADFAPAKYQESKIKKTGAAITLELANTTDILAYLGRARKKPNARPQRPYLVGFAMETEKLEERAQEKLERKACDMIVANDLGAPGAGFAVDTNQVAILETGGGLEQVPLSTKGEVANRILDRIAKNLVSTLQELPQE